MFYLKERSSGCGSRKQLARQAWSQSWLLGGGGVPPPISLLSAAPLHSKSEPLWRLWDSALQGEVVSCLKSYITSWWCLSPKLFCEVVDEINRIKNTTGFYRVDELVSLLQLYTVGDPNLIVFLGQGVFSGTWQSLQHTNLIHSFLFLSQSFTRLLTKRTWKNEKLWLTFIALEITETIKKLSFTANVKTES